jgi:hypothetical protein
MEKLAVRTLVPWEWVEDYYGYQQLPLMIDLPPLRLHVDSRATSVAVHQPDPF